MLRQNKEKVSFYEILRKIKNNRLILKEEGTKEVWSVEKQIIFLESILIGMIPSTIYLAENSSGKRFAFDGFNRLNTLIKFYNDEIKLSNLEILKDYEGFRCSDLPPVKQAYIEDKEFSLVIIQPPTDKELMYELIKRANSEFINKELFFDLMK